MSGDNNLLVCRGIWKRFCRDFRRSILYAVGDIWCEVIRNRKLPLELRKKEFWALKDVSIEIKRGDAIGLVGRNGSGKTTLLSVLAGVMLQTRGEVVRLGRIAPLPAKVIGFKPILTGTENAVTMMSILGLSPREARRKAGWVMEFAELGEAAGAPLGKFSSGMAARLGMGCALAAEPDVFILDEVMSVGDLKFKAKCRAELEEHRARGGAFVFVSHDAHAVSSFCSEAVYLKHGTIRMRAEPAEVLREYEHDLGMDEPDIRDAGRAPLYRRDPAAPIDRLAITEIGLLDGSGRPSESICTGEAASLRVRLAAAAGLEDVRVRVVLARQGALQNAIAVLSSPSYRLERGMDVNARVVLSPSILLPGRYVAHVGCFHGDREICHAPGFCFRSVAGDAPVEGVVHQPARWESALQPAEYAGKTLTRAAANRTEKFSV